MHKDHDDRGIAIFVFILHLAGSAFYSLIDYKFNIIKICLKIKDLGICSQVNQMGASIQYHVRIELGLINLTSLCAGNSNAYWDLVFN